MASIKLIVTGATGTAGSEVLRQALLHPRIEQVTVLVRRPLPPHVQPADSSKLNVVIQKDFGAAGYTPEIMDQLHGHHAVIWAQGISSVGMSEEDYKVITIDYPTAAATALSKIFQPAGTRFVFNYLSGHGAWQEDGKASQMFGRVKGQAEKALASNFPSLATYNFRPAGILPTRPIPEASFLYRCGTPIMKAIRLVAPSMVITTEQLARGMIEAALQGSTGSIPGWEGKGKPGDKGVFDNEEIKVLAKTSPLS